MKLANVEVGMDVQVKKTATRFAPFARNRVGKVVGIDYYSAADLDVCVKFDEDASDWGSHSELKRIKEGVV